ncbi:hypothetical protein AB0C69_17190 [Actinomadura sp. NPDC048032]|uniref:hypothetical protein n=1 Tax=Actinomadura sp. NPDC048032 TaxID=3155747 RepID=UPI0033FE6ED4
MCPPAAVDAGDRLADPQIGGLTSSLAERELALEEGWIVLTGGMTDAVPLEPDRPVTAEFTHLGGVTVSCGEARPM